MVEELTSEVIQELTNAVNNLSDGIQVSSSSTDAYLITLIPASIAIIGIFIAFFRFNQTQRQSKNLEFMKQLEYYGIELTEIKREFSNSNKKFEDCVNYAKRILVILNRISFLREKKLINQDFVQYFQNDFNGGRTFLNWLEFTERSHGTWKNTYADFNKIKDTGKFSSSGVMISEAFYYYAHQVNEDPSYDPELDTGIPKSYLPTEADTDLLSS